MDHAGRLRRLQHAISEQPFDALLVTHLPNVRYLCGFTGSAAALVVSGSKTVFFTDGRYTAQAHEEVQGCRVVVNRKPAVASAASWLSGNRRKIVTRGPCRAGVEGEHLSMAEAKRVKRILGPGFILKPVRPLVEQARMVKDADEIKNLRQAVALGSKLFDTVRKAIRPGTREDRVAAELEYAARKAGAEAMSFESIIASGKRSALPHGRASNADIPVQGFVVCDFGVILAGYCSDMTRTVHVGRASGEARSLYAAVREAQQAAVDAVRPGASVGDIDRAARKLLQKKGFGRYFSHSTGHGVGLEIHELPRVAAGQTDALQPGMVITIEPGAYIPGKWGVRIEDMVVVTEAGCEVLTDVSKQLIEI